MILEGQAGLLPYPVSLSQHLQCLLSPVLWALPGQKGMEGRTREIAFPQKENEESMPGNPGGLPSGGGSLQDLADGFPEARDG